MKRDPQPQGPSAPGPSALDLARRVRSQQGTVVTLPHHPDRSATNLAAVVERIG